MRALAVFFLVASLAVASSVSWAWAVAGSGVLGDVTGDGYVDSRDVTIIRQLIGAPGFPWEADVDGDGLVTMNDARAAVLRCTLPRCKVV